MIALGVIAWSALCAAAPEPAERMVKYSSPTVRLYTDIGKTNAANVLDEIAFFETYLDGFFKSYGMGSRKKNPIRCRLFVSQEEFQEYRRKTNAPFYAGAYFSKSNNCIIAPYAGGAKIAFGQLLHECAHVIQTRYIVNQVPWLDEGLACYFEATEFDPHHNVISLCNDKRIAELRRMLERDRLMDWERFFEIQGYEVDQAYRDGVIKVDEFYAQSWGVVYFYLHSTNEEVREVFEKFIKGMNTGRERSKIIYKDIRTREEEFRAFINSPGHEQIRALFQEARKLRQWEKYESALENLRSILRNEPNHKAARFLMAETAFDGGFHEVSLEHWRWLAEKEPKEKTYLWKICRCLTEIGRGSEDSAIQEEAITSGKAAVRATKKQDPDSLAALAMAYHAAQELEEALSTIRKALRFKCEQRDYYKTLEQQYKEDLLRNDF